MERKDKIKIILVEDDFGQSRLIRKNISKTAGLDVEWFDTGRAFLESLQDKTETELSHYVLILDLHLPGINGNEVLKHIRETKKTALMPVFILSSTDHQDEIRQCYELGASLYFSKSMDYRHFQRTLDAIANIILYAHLP